MDNNMSDNTNKNVRKTAGKIMFETESEAASETLSETTGETSTPKLSVAQNMMWNSVGSFVYLFMQWVLTIIIVKIVGFGENGYFTLAMSLTNTFGVIANYGMRNYQVSDVNDKYTNGTYIASRYITSIVAMLAMTVFTLANGYSKHVAIILITYMIFKLSETFVDVYQAICQKEWRMDIVGKSLLIRGVLTTLSFTITLYLTRSLPLSILSMIIVAYVVVFGYDVKFSRKITNVSFDKNYINIKKLLIECLPLVIYLFLSNWIISMPRYFLEREHGSDILGIYGSISTPTVIVQVAAAYMFTPLISIFAQHFAKKDIKEFVLLIAKVMIGIAAVAVVAIIGCMIFGDWGLKLLFGEKILEYSYLLIPVLVVTILNAIVWFLCALLTVLRDFKGLIISNVLMFIVSFVASVTLISKYSMDGVNLSLYIALGFAIIILSIFVILKIRKGGNDK